MPSCLYLERSIPEGRFWKAASPLTRCGGDLKMRCSLGPHCAIPGRPTRPTSLFPRPSPRFLSFLEPLSFTLKCFLPFYELYLSSTFISTFSSHVSFNPRSSILKSSVKFLFRFFLSSPTPSIFGHNTDPS